MRLSPFLSDISRSGAVKFLFPLPLEISFILVNSRWSETLVKHTTESPTPSHSLWVKLGVMRLNYKRGWS